MNFVLDATVALLGDLDIATDPETVERAWGDTLNMARRTDAIV